MLMSATIQIRPIRNDKNHRAALAEIEKLWGASIGTPEGDKLDILVTLVETYEERRWPLKSRRRFDPIDVLHYAIQELGHSQAELADILGSRSRASEILARRRYFLCRLFAVRSAQQFDALPLRGAPLAGAHHNQLGDRIDSDGLRCRSEQLLCAATSAGHRGSLTASLNGCSPCCCGSSTCGRGSPYHDPLGLPG
jgi:HTH-type transcriptional regulator/antitoxin HigA